MTKTDIGIGCVTISFWLTFISAFGGVSFFTYLSAFFLIVGLLAIKKVTPHVFLIVISLAVPLYLLSPSPTLIASFFPLLGFLFCGNRYIPLNEQVRSDKWMVISCYLFIIIFSFLSGSVGSASHNYISVIVVYALIFEKLVFDRTPRWYIPVIIYCFFILGNRSSIFLLAVFLRSKIALVGFATIAALFIGMTLGDIEIFKGAQIFFAEGGILNRSYGETRGDYIDEFIKKFNFAALAYDNWKFSTVPQTQGGFYDLHNSFLTLVVRDSYLGIFKILLWTSQIFFLPVGFFIGVSARAYFDTFLLGGVNDILTYAMIGSFLRVKCKKLIEYLRINK